MELRKEYCPRASDFTYKGGYNAMDKILNLEDKPTAILTFDDVVGIGAMKAIKDKGYLIPDDFSLIGFDNILINEYLDTTLSSITFPTEVISNEALKIFFNKSNTKNKSYKRIILKPVLKIRDSISSPKI